MGPREDNAFLRGITGFQGPIGITAAVLAERMLPHDTPWADMRAYAAGAAVAWRVLRLLILGFLRLLPGRSGTQ